MYDLYLSTKGETARFLLGRSGPKPLIVLGLNPSTANRERVDTTVAKVEKIAAMQAFAGFQMLNLYPLRATDTRSLPNEKDSELYTENMAVILDALNQVKKISVWCGWGQGILLRSYLLETLEEIAYSVKSKNIEWLRYGPQTKEGHPRHPSRAHYAWAFNEFDIQLYLKTLSEKTNRLKNKKPRLGL